MSIFIFQEEVDKDTYKVESILLGKDCVKKGGVDEHTDMHIRRTQKSLQNLLLMDPYKPLKGCVGIIDFVSKNFTALATATISSAAITL